MHRERAAGNTSSSDCGTSWSPNLLGGPSGHLDFRAPSLIAFVQVAAKVSDETWLRHLRQGNYSRWFREVLHDPVLAEEAAAFECRDDVPVTVSRAGVRAAVKRLYATT